MEVHHHTHTGRKRFLNYFWEFIMLFLAVFCGFLAEYQLEHRIEKERARQYIRSFYDDLKSDTAQFSSLIADYSRRFANIEKRKECYITIKKDPTADQCLENIFNSASGFYDLITSDQTLLQLKNAGGFRLLDRSDADSILGYDNMIRLYVRNETTGFQQNQYFIRQTIFALRNYATAAMPGDSSNRILFSHDPQLLNTFFNSLERWLMVSLGMFERLVQLKKQATGLIDYFKNKYHLK
jgi:hypothetical protein